MAQVERPLSPHLQIYKPQLTSVLSILHRITGIGLGIGTRLLAWWLVSAADGPEHVVHGLHLREDQRGRADRLPLLHGGQRRGRAQGCTRWRCFGRGQGKVSRLRESRE